MVESQSSTLPTRDPLSVLTVGLIAIVTMATLGGLAWAALAYDKPDMLALVLTPLPVVCTVLVDLLRKALQAKG